jgi:hypothetical protein
MMGPCAGTGTLDNSGCGRVETPAWQKLATTVDPVKVTLELITANEALRGATQTAGDCKDICTAMKGAFIHQVPIICKLLKIGHIFPDEKKTKDLNAALYRCLESALLE